MRVVNGAAIVALAVAGALGAAPACVAKPEFHCVANDACTSEEGEPGICEASGFCSFPDNACSESGRRYADGAGASLASSCVAVAAADKCIADLGLGTDFGCFATSDGSAFCWGANDEGQLGDGTTTAHASPTRVAMPAGARVAKIAAGEAHACALTTDGDVYCWGANDTRQLGVGTEDSKAPVKVAVQAGTPAAPVKVTAIDVGGKHTCAVADGAVYCWGENSDGQCGQDAAKADDVETPAPVAALEGIVSVATGDEFTCALKDDKSVWCWGANASGELGNGTKSDSPAPVKVVLASVGQLVAGDEHACGAKDDGSIWCWGYGQSGALGSGSKDDAPTPAAAFTAQRVASGGEAFHTCAVTAAAELYCWGANDVGQVGAGAPDPNVLTPAAARLVTVKDVALGGKHTCAVTLDGALWCWGANDVGQLGLGTSGAPELVPKRVAFTCPR